MDQNAKKLININKITMPEPIITTITSTQLTKIAVMATFGAIIHALIAHRKGETKSLIDIFTLTVISAFGGVIGGLFAVKIYPADEILLFIGSGMGGYLGVEGLTYLVNFIK